LKIFTHHFLETYIPGNRALQIHRIPEAKGGEEGARKEGKDPEETGQKQEVVVMSFAMVIMVHDTCLTPLTWSKLRCFFHHTLPPTLVSAPC